MLAIPGSVHINVTRSTRSAIQILAHHLESAVFIACNPEPWKLGRDRFELREMFGRYRHGGPAGRAQLAMEMFVEPGLAAKR